MAHLRFFITVSPYAWGEIRDKSACKTCCGFATEFVVKMYPCPDFGQEIKVANLRPVCARVTFFLCHGFTTPLSSNIMGRGFQSDIQAAFSLKSTWNFAMLSGALHNSLGKHFPHLHCCPVNISNMSLSIFYRDGSLWHSFFLAGRHCRWHQWPKMADRADNRWFHHWP